MGGNSARRGAPAAIMDAIQMSGRSANADDLFPILIYVILQANPVRLLSTMLYIRFFFDVRACLAPLPSVGIPAAAHTAVEPHVRAHLTADPSSDGRAVVLVVAVYQCGGVYQDDARRPERAGTQPLMRRPTLGARANPSARATTGARSGRVAAAVSGMRARVE